MKELFINEIAPIAVTAVVAILVAIIKQVGNAAIEFLIEKKKEAEQRIKISGHEAELNDAKEVWNIIEEKFRITENAAQILSSKADEFDKVLLQRVPGLSQQNIEDLRQAVAGEFNRGKAALNSSSVIASTSEISLGNGNLSWR